MVQVVVVVVVGYEDGGVDFVFFGFDDVWVVQVDVQFQVVIVVVDYEGVVLQCYGYDGCVLVGVCQEEILVFFQVEQYDGLEVGFVFDMLEDDGEMGLQLVEFGWQCQGELVGVVQGC